jgi:hypothetical protein
MFPIFKAGFVHPDFSMDIYRMDKNYPKFKKTVFTRQPISKKTAKAQNGMILFRPIIRLSKYFTQSQMMTKIFILLRERNKKM